MDIIQTPARIFSTGGVERYVRDLSRALSGRGHAVRVICAASRDRVVEIPGVSVQLLNPICKLANTDITPGLPGALLGGECDLIHTHLPTPWSADWSAVVAGMRKKPLVLSYYNDISGKGSATALAYLYNHTFLRYILDQADRIIVLREAYPFGALEDYNEKIRVIPPGVDMNRYSPRRGERRADIFFLSVLDEFHHYKGLDTLISAVALARKEYPDIRMIVGGSGTGTLHYQEIARSMDLEKNIMFAGFIPDDELPAYYSACGMFVLPSKNPTLEGFGMVLLEALACGRPVVATSIAGPAKDIEQYGAGLIVRPGAPEEMANAITTILADRSLELHMGNQGRRLVEEQYDWTRVAGRVEEVYRELV